MKQALGIEGTKTDTRVLNLTIDPYNETLLHMIARAFGPYNIIRMSRYIGILYGSGQFIVPRVSRDRRRPWFKLMLECVQAGALLHAIDSKGRTPLMTMIEHYCAQWRPGINSQNFINRLLDILEEWVLELFRIGVSLQEFGEMERAMFLQAGNPQKRYARDEEEYMFWRGMQDVTLDLFDFQFGPNPEDWYF